MDEIEKEIMSLLIKRYSRMSDILIELKKGMSSRGNLELDIPRCPVCPEPKILEYCQTYCEWAKIFGICKKMGGEQFPEYGQIVNGLNQALRGFIFILGELNERNDFLNDRAQGGEQIL